MREVVKWNQNNITGKRTELKCLKADNGLIGRASIQLFDEDGNLKNETYTENIIPTWMTEADYYNGLYTSVQGGEILRGFKGNLPTFQHILLSDDDREENKDNLTRIGKVIGWCPRISQNAGADTTRGVYNPTESYTKITADRYYHAHLVYDFGTSQGNGTFKSIYWANGVSADYALDTLMWYAPYNALHKQINSYDEQMTLSIDDKVIKIVENKEYEVINLFSHLNGLEPVKLSETPLRDRVSTLCKVKGGYITIENKVEITGENWDTNFDIVHYDYNKTELKRVHINSINALDSNLNASRTKYGGSDPGDYLRISDLELAWKNGDISIKFLAHTKRTYMDAANSSGVISKIDTVTYKGVFNIFTETWKLLPKTLEKDCFKFIATSNKAKFEIDGFEILCPSINSSSSDKFLMLKDDLYTEAGVFNIVGSSSTLGGYNFVYIKSHAIAMYGGDVVKLIPYSAHTKLPAPVVKTSADTMKIQYDYYIQIPHIIPADGDFITPPVEATKEK